MRQSAFLNDFTEARNSIGIDNCKACTIGSSLNIAKKPICNPRIQLISDPAREWRRNRKNSFLDHRDLWLSHSSRADHLIMVYLPGVIAR